MQKGIYTTSSPLVVAVAVNATNATKNDEINLSDAIHSEGTLSNQETTEKEKLAKLIANHYPADNIMIIMFEYIGLILFMAGFLYFLKHILIYICKTICRKRQKKKLLHGNCVGGQREKYEYQIPQTKKTNKDEK